MELQTQPNNWSCMVTAFAIALGVPVDYIIKILGHDGSEIIFPDLPEPECRRGFHIQEIIDFARIHREQAIVEIQPQYCFGNRYDEKTWTPDIDFVKRFENAMRDYRGVIGLRLVSGRQHALAWDRKLTYDPRGNGHTDFTIDSEGVIVFWILESIGTY